MMLDLALAILLTGLAAAGLAGLVRALPLPRAWKVKKPLGCPACLAGHASWIAYAYAVVLGVLPWRGVWWFGAFWLSITGVCVCAIGISGVASGFDALFDGGTDVRPVDGGGGSSGESADGPRAL
jgi:hypothetical protein